MVKSITAENSQILNENFVSCILHFVFSHTKEKIFSLTICLRYIIITLQNKNICQKIQKTKNFAAVFAVLPQIKTF